MKPGPESSKCVHRVHTTCHCKLLQINMSLRVHHSCAFGHTAKCTQTMNPSASLISHNELKPVRWTSDEFHLDSSHYFENSSTNSESSTSFKKKNPVRRSPKNKPQNTCCLQWELCCVLTSLFLTNLKIGLSVQEILSNSPPTLLLTRERTRSSCLRNSWTIVPDLAVVL